MGSSRVLAALITVALTIAATTRDSKSFEDHIGTSATIDHKNFLISEVSASSQAVPRSTKVKRTFKFKFFDHNSETYTHCAQTWEDEVDIASGVLIANPPSSYILCPNSAGTAVDNSFRMRFSASYTTFGNFTLNLAHSVRDDINFTPPYDILTYFAIDCNLALDCVLPTHENTSTDCHLAGNATSVVATVNGISA
ncbi:hypothetical protein GLAREA_01801 [Glarea lozoyensis ATCC 20868]|uniref:AA1-like domain-containing protein n=1 Tax=Glarea lozoyensis (strain ATCC 20868 / MF5171) TaxID=1116229 RepID=S3CL04_GLAL2|nr:uncharacterized protein GLAREA_01801 [Glarea lozoyensis ATCC 20868]EPE25889.1 hypothetical protein GLAREA_01801 [Glarea lozoyensis ATCC 20868]